MQFSSFVTGDIFRKNVGESTDLGILAKVMMTKLVPDELL